MFAQHQNLKKTGTYIERPVNQLCNNNNNRQSTSDELKLLQFSAVKGLVESATIVNRAINRSLFSHKSTKCLTFYL